LTVILLALLLIGWGLIWYVAHDQAREAERSPWSKSLVLVGPEPEFTPRHALVYRRLTTPDLPVQDPSRAQFMAQLRTSEGGPEFIEALELDYHEYVALLDLPPEQWATLLESGRPPTPGTREVLRGPLARFDLFRLDGEAFQVVGRLRRDLPGLGFGYLLPDDPRLKAAHFSGATVAHAWLLPEAERHVKEGKLKTVGRDAPEILPPLAPAPERDPRLTIAGLALMAIGGSGLQLMLMAKLSRRSVPLLGTALKEIAASPALVTFFHVAYYGLFFAMMWMMISHPLWSLRLNAFLDQSFETGMLAYVRESYVSGDVFQAAFATWAWNYGVATLLLVYLPSLVPVLGAAFGLGKTALSFGMVGAGMSPLWYGMPETLIYHSGTMVLELEAYILTAFIIVAFTAHIIRGIQTWRNGGAARTVHAFKLFAGGALLAGLLLAFAGLYEAATIIAFSGLTP
jgi:hypothetical protein